MISALMPVAGFVSVPKPRLEADYVIVGAGAAGCPLAARLAAAGFDVLLLEEGPNDGGTHFSTLFNTDIDPYDASRGDATQQLLMQFTAPDIARNVFSEPVWEPGFERQINASGSIYEVHMFGLQAIGQLPDDFGLRSFEQHAKIVGGNTMHNLMLYFRPGNASIGHFGSDLWSPETMTQVFEEMERDHLKLPHDITFNNSVHANVHLGIDKRPEQAFLDAAMAVEDAYAVPRGRLAGAQKRRWSVSSIERTRDANSQRISAARAFLTDQVRALPNLEVRPMSKALKVVVEGKEGDKVATGVVYRDVKAGTEFEVKARKEVILSLGALFTPWMLQLSGIGPQEELAQNNIPVHVPLPGVGENFQNHMLVSFYMGGPAELTEDTCGPFPGCVLDSAVHTFSSQSSPEAGDDADLTIYTLSAVYDPANHRSVFTVEVMVGAQVKSKGSVHLSSNTADVYPSIRPGYYQGEGVADLDTLSEGVQIFIQQVLARMGPEYYVIEPTANVPFADWAKAKAGSHWHYAGTCKMAEESDPMGVVDERLRVRGVTGLRVADMSVVPVEPNVHTQALAMAIGYRAASLIVEDA